jgi:hypothetical protein
LEGGAGRGNSRQSKSYKQYLLAGCDVMRPEYEFFHSVSYQMRTLRRETMKVKINEDWLATILAFVLLLLAMVNFIKPEWVKF